MEEASVQIFSLDEPHCDYSVPTFKDRRATVLQLLKGENHKPKVPVGNYHEYLSQFIQAAITAQSRHPGEITQGSVAPAA